MGDVVENRGALVQASDRGGLMIDEGLYAEADAVHAAAYERLQDRGREGSWGASDRALSAGQDGEVRANGMKQVRQRTVFESCAGASSQEVRSQSGVEV